MTVILTPPNWPSIIFCIFFVMFLTYGVFEPPKWLRRFYSGVWYIIWSYIKVAAIFGVLTFGLLGIGYVFSLDF